MIAMREKKLFSVRCLRFFIPVFTGIKNFLKYALAHNLLLADLPVSFCRSESLDVNWKRFYSRFFKSSNQLLKMFVLSFFILAISAKVFASLYWVQRVEILLKFQSQTVMNSVFPISCFVEILWPWRCP